MFYPSLSWSLEQRIEILQGLIAMRRAGEFSGVWCDNWRIRVQHRAHIGGCFQITWDAAAEMVEAFRKKEQTCSLSNSSRTNRRK